MFMINFEKHKINDNKMQVSDISVTLRNLGVMAQLQHNDKLSTEGEFFNIYGPTAFRSLYRTIYRESREINILRVISCIQHAKTFVTTVIGESSANCGRDRAAEDTVSIQFHKNARIQQCTRVLSSLSDVAVGLDNLAKTYRDDPAMCVKIQQLKNDLTDFIENTQLIADSSPVIARLR